MNEKILKQLRYKNTDAGFLGLKEENTVISHDEVINRIISYPLTVLQSIIDTDFPRMTVEVPLSILVNDAPYVLDFEEFRKSQEVQYVSPKHRDVYPETFKFNFILTSPFATSFDITLVYDNKGKEERPDFVEVDIYNDHPTIYFIDNVTGDIGHFPESVPFAILEGDKERFLSFKTEVERDDFFANVFDLSDDLEEALDDELSGGICNCRLCREGIKEAFGPSPLKEVMDSLRVAYKASEKVTQESKSDLVSRESIVSPGFFTKEQLDYIDKAVSSTSHLSAAVRPQAIRSILTSSKL